jgi:hypothetical protein
MILKGIPTMRLGLFELTVFLTDDAFELEVFAGQDRDQVDSAQDRFRILQTTRNDIVREILLKLERALAANATSIEVNVQGEREIIRDSTFPLPAFAAAAAPAAVATRSRGIVLATGKAAEPASAPGAPRPKRARAGKSRAAKAKAAKQPAAKSEHAGKKRKKTAADQPGTKKKSRTAAGKTVSNKRKPKSDGA